MSLLSELLADSRPLATPATVATLPPEKAENVPRVARVATVQDSCTKSDAFIPAAVSEPEKSQESQESQRPAIQRDPAKVRARLLVLAEGEGIDAGLVRALPESELTATGQQCAAVEAEQPGRGRELALQYLHTLATSATMRAGRLPPDFDTPAMCRHCGPVWLPASQVVMLDMVNGWPRALGCPWCFIRKAGLYVPRPPVTCAECQHYQPDSVNPASGCGSCAIGMRQVGGGYPHRQRQCKAFQPKEPRA